MLDGGVDNDAADAGQQKQSEQQSNAQISIEVDAKISEERMARLGIERLVQHVQARLFRKSSR